MPLWKILQPSLVDDITTIAETLNDFFANIGTKLPSAVKGDSTNA